MTLVFDLLVHTDVIITIIKTTSEVGDGGRDRSGRGRHATVSATQEQTLSGRGARVYTAHRGWLGVVTGINAASTGSVLAYVQCHKLVYLTASRYRIYTWIM